ncbi:hypothetical protein VSR01_17470 [Actinacidiphila sp. DG2A-62]|uniref:hypothetical protein n=1 Tax=Actinacidiphila sp. DG2A-62 TaxID=3108821 RepID=UPI002DBC71BC|nr:hypothetical protein [Actinacidiphila sp. DG2A-62]MEC3995229.1 hypothetical protein [Actinacidiphila sp. DG2A-62]
MQFQTEEEVRDFLRLCLDPGHGVKRTPAKLTAIMPDLLRDRLEGHAPHLADLRQEAERAEAATEKARAAHAEALGAWIEGDTPPPHLADLRQEAERAEAATEKARAAHAEALGAWIEGDTPPTGAASAPAPRAATQNSPAPVQRRYLDSFAKNASTDAIQAHIVARRADRRGLERHIDFLEALLTHRSQQIAAGTWPTPQPQHTAAEPNDEGDDS